MEKLLESGADMSAANSDAKTALMLAEDPETMVIFKRSTVTEHHPFYSIVFLNLFTISFY